MKQLYLTLLGLSLLSAATAQISITSTNMPASGDTIRYSNASLASLGNYTVTGANYTWNFDSLKYTTQGIRQYKPSLSTPYGFFFLPPKYGEKIQDTIKLPSIPGFTLTITDIYNFYKNTSASYAVEGLGIKLSGIPVPNFYSDQDELYMFPVNYLNRDSTTFKFSTITSTLVPFVYKKQGYRITEADGWGTISTPFGTTSCLRVVTTQYSQDSLSGTIAGFPFKVGFPDYQRSYQWLTTSQKIPFLEVLGTVTGTNFTPTQVRYRDSTRFVANPLGLQELASPIVLNGFPNPATSQFNLVLSRVNGPVKAMISDISGKQVQTEVLENCQDAFNVRSISVQNLAPGTYFLKLEYAGGAQTLKFSKQ